MVRRWFSESPRWGAVSADPGFILGARDLFKACKADCRDQYHESKDLCLNVDPACGDACRTGRATCAAPYLATLETCVDACRAQLQEDKGACPPRDDPARDACIDAAQVKAFMCRDTCREDETVREGIRTCRKALRACLRACPAPS